MSSLIMFKSQLQEYSQKHSLSAPIYEHVKEGPSHEPKFTATVIVNGVRYDSPTAFRNRKTAEHAAAQVALQELGKAANGAGDIPNPVFESGLCKNLLQEYAQKLNLPVPSYCCEKAAGEGHTSIFISTVEIAGISYVGGPAKNKKTAEIKAARTALSAIQTQYCSQGAFTNPTSSLVGAVTNSTHGDVLSGIKRERASDQPSGERTGVKTKKRKQSKKRMGKRRQNTVVNGQQTSAENTSTIDIKDEQSHPQQMPIDDGQKTKQITSAENTLAIDGKDEQSHPQQMSIDEAQQIKQVEGLESQETGQKSEDQEMVQSAGEEVKQLGALGESEQHNQGDAVTDGLEKNQQDKQDADHENCKFESSKEEKKNGTPDCPGNDEQDEQQLNQGIEKLPVDKEVQKVKEEHKENGTQEAPLA